MARRPALPASYVKQQSQRFWDAMNRGGRRRPLQEYVTTPSQTEGIQAEERPGVTMRGSTVGERRMERIMTGGGPRSPREREEYEAEMARRQRESGRQYDVSRQKFLEGEKAKRAGIEAGTEPIVTPEGETVVPALEQLKTQETVAAWNAAAEMGQAQLQSQADTLRSNVDVWKKQADLAVQNAKTPEEKRFSIALATQQDLLGKATDALKAITADSRTARANGAAIAELGATIQTLVSDEEHGIPALLAAMPTPGVAQIPEPPTAEQPQGAATEGAQLQGEALALDIVMNPDKYPSVTPEQVEQMRGKLADKLKPNAETNKK